MKSINTAINANTTLNNTPNDETRNTMSVFHAPDWNNDLQTWTREEVASMLHCGTDQITSFYEEGLLNGTKYGRTTVFQTGQIKNFLNQTIGLDLSNRAAIKKAIENGQIDLASIKKSCSSKVIKASNIQ